MKITKYGVPQTIMSNPDSIHNYFAWPSVARLQNGKIAVVASGFRRRHVCPFGKTVIAYSENNGETYTAPAPVIDTVLDDRDGGESWDAGYDIYVNNVSWDLGYPSTVELDDGSLLTVFYAHPSKEDPAIIMQQKWRFEDEI